MRIQCLDKHVQEWSALSQMATIIALLESTVIVIDEVELAFVKLVMQALIALNVRELTIALGIYATRKSFAKLIVVVQVLVTSTMVHVTAFLIELGEHAVRRFAAFITNFVSHARIFNASTVSEVSI